MKGNKSFAFNFADFEVREREFCITRAGEVLPVEPKAFRLLLFLLHNPQRLITKEELLDAVWSDTSVSENSLARNIALLRRLLGDDFREPIFIATVAAVGYKFICPIEISEDPQDAPPAETIPFGMPSAQSGSHPLLLSETSTKGFHMAAVAISKESVEAIHAEKAAGHPQELPRRYRTRIWLIPAAIFAIVLVAAFWHMRRPLPQLRLSEYSQITHDARRKNVFGTDGASLYLNFYPDSHPVARVSVSGGEIVRVPIPLKNPWLDDASPVSSALLVESDDGNPNGLWSVGAFGGSLRHLIDGEFSSAAWSPDGKSVAYSTVNGDVSVIQSDGTGQKTLANLPYTASSVLQERLAWSPDGRTIRFDRNSKIFEVAANGSGLHQLLPNWRPNSWMCCGQWTPDGKSYIFLSWDAPLPNYPLFPPSQIWVLDQRSQSLRHAPTEPYQLTSGPMRWGRPILSVDGKKVFGRGVILNGELVRLDASSHQLQPYLGGISAEAVSFSPDGKFIAYVTYPEGILWRANRDGSSPMQLSDPPLYPILPRWSPDSSQILFSQQEGENDSRIFIVSAQGGRPRPLLPEFNDSNASGSWSPDGRQVVFDAWEPAAGSRKHAIRILDLGSRQIMKIPGEMAAPSWSPDGKSLAALASGTGALTLYDFEMKKWSTLTNSRIDFPTWSRDSKFIYFSLASEDQGIYRIRSTGGKVERILDLKGFRFASVFEFETWFGLDPDDQLMLQRDIGGDDIYALSLEEK